MGIKLMIGGEGWNMGIGGVRVGLCTLDTVMMVALLIGLGHRECSLGGHVDDRYGIIYELIDFALLDREIACRGSAPWLRER